MTSSRSYLIILGSASAALVCAAIALRVIINPQANVADVAIAAPRENAIPETDPSFLEPRALSSANASNTPQSSDSNALTSIENSVIGSISKDGATAGSVKSEPAASNKSPITAYAYLVGNVKTGKIYITSHPDVPLPEASMSKLITTAAAMFSLSATSTIEISKQDAALPPDGSDLVAGEKFSLNELLYPMLVASSNVAAEAIADSVNRQKFLDLMSGYAWEIGMPQTYFADPSGLDPRNVSSAYNVFALAKYLYSYHPDILAITRNARMEIASTSEHGQHTFESTHPFVNDARFIGGKTGRTPEAGETMLTILNMNGEPVAFIVLGSKIGARESDTKLLIDEYQKKVLASL